MKVLLFNGSINEKGCTYTALGLVAKELENQGIDTEIIYIGEGDQRKRAAELKDKVAEADGYVFGSPVYYASASGIICDFMDKLFISQNKNMAYKPATCVVSCRRGGASAAFDRLNKYFTICNMPVVSSNYWNMVHGNKPEEVLRDEEGVQTMSILGKNMAWLLKAIDVAKQNGIAHPEPEAKVHTNFIR